MSMDVIFRVHEQEFISEPVHFGQFQSDAAESRDRSFGLVGEDGQRKIHAESAHFAAFAGVGKEEAEDVFNLVDVSKLCSSRVHYNLDAAEPAATAVLPASWHKSLGYLKKEHTKRLNPQYKSVAGRMLKYDRVELSLLTVPKYDPFTDCEGAECRRGGGLRKSDLVGEVTLEDDEATSADEIIITCSIYFGYSRPLHYDEKRLGRLMKVTDKLQVLGSSTLLDLKNSFQCPSDIAFTDDMSTTPPYPHYLAKFRFPNSYFFIHDTFYIDDSVQHDAYEDLSTVVRDWASDKEFIGPMKVAYMSNTRLIDIKARLGMPYLFVHQGQCEHLICFTDLRLWEERDPQFLAYPIKMQEKIFRRTCCIGCKMNTAEWVVLESDRLPFTPAFLCNDCYVEFNFTKEGYKLGSFMSVPFCDRKAMDRDSHLFMEKLAERCRVMEEQILAAGRVNQLVYFDSLHDEGGEYIEIQPKREKSRKRVRHPTPPTTSNNNNEDLLSL